MEGQARCLPRWATVVKGPRSGGTSRWLPTRSSVAVLVGGLLLTALLTWASVVANADENARLLGLEVRQASSALSAALPSIQVQLANALTVAGDTNSPAIFDRFVDRQPLQSQFASISLWQRNGTGTTMVAHVGSPPLLVGDAAARFLAGARPDVLHVSPILAGSPRRIGYALAEAEGEGFVVYAENPLPARTALTVPPSSPFGQLNYAVYLGSTATSGGLLESSAHVPIRGQTATSQVPFGDTYITVVGTPRVRLVGGASVALPWIAGGLGALLSVTSAMTVGYVVRRRRRAEHLTDEVTRLYAEQRSIAETLQQALLPEELPMIEGLEIAARYVAGSSPADVGGDWYDVVRVDDEKLVFVIGDVSGRGVKAATVMASLRFATRAYALEGYPPGLILNRLQGILDFGADRHFATVLCGQIDLVRKTVAVASAGHLPPVVYAPGRAESVRLVPAPPIGVKGRQEVTPEQTVIDVVPGMVLVGYTDGLVERRSESLDESIHRLETMTLYNPESLESMLDGIVASLLPEKPDDDLALIGLRWQA